MTAHRKNLLQTLENWTLSGGSWRVVSISDQRAVVDRCSYTGEPLERLESDDRAAIAHLRTRHSVSDPNRRRREDARGVRDVEPSSRSHVPVSARQ